MGYSFANIQIRKLSGTAPDAEQIAGILTAGRKVAEAAEGEAADIVIDILQETDSPWITVVSDLFDEDNEECIRSAGQLSGALQTQALAVYCFDSDYLFLNLLDAEKGTDAWAACGHFPLGKAPRRSNFSAWKNDVTDVSALRQVMQKHYVFAEECLEGLTDILSLPVSQSGRCMDSAAPASGVRRFRYRLTEAFEPGKLPVFICDFPSVSYAFGTDNIVSFSSKGGASRGVGVFFGGPCLASRLVEIESVSIEQQDGRGGRTKLPVYLKQTAFKSGQTGWYCELPEVSIPQAVPSGLPWKKAMDLRFQKMINVRFRLLRTFRAEYAERLGELRIALIPLKNFPGQDSVILSGPGEECTPAPQPAG